MQKTKLHQEFGNSLQIQSVTTITD